MYKYICLFIIISATSYTQNDVNSVLNYTLSYRGLSREDVTIPIDFFSAAEKSPTNDAKLILPIVRDIMINPLRSMTWIDSMGQFLKLGPQGIVNLIYEKCFFLYPGILTANLIYIEEDDYHDHIFS